MNRLFLWGFIALVIIVTGGAVFLFSRGGEASPTDQDQNISLASPVSSEDHAKGGENASVVLVEYGDFQCPACAAYFPWVQQVERDFEEDVKIVFRHFPLRNIHRNAQIASQAAEAAALQDKFWEMHDMLFANQSSWANERDPKDMFVEYAGSIGLDTERFRGDLESEAVEDKVNEDFQSGQRSGVDGTPTFFVQGEEIPLPQSYAMFSQHIRLMLPAQPQAQDGEEEDSVEEQEDESSEPTE